MGTIVYLADHAAVMTPLVVEAALQRCPVGTETQRCEYVSELHAMGIHPDVDPTTGLASEIDRRRFYHIRTELRALGLPLFQQKAIWARFSDQWDLFWGVTGKPDRDTLLRVPTGDLQQIIAANKAPYPYVPDLAVRLLLRRQEAEGQRTGAQNPFIEAELLRLATEDPLRLYSELGTAYYLKLLEGSEAQAASHMVGDLMTKGLGGFDGRVIPMVGAVADRYEGAFTPEQMPILVGLAEKFPVLKNVFIKLRSRPELLKAALAACFDDCGQLVVGERVAGSVDNAFSRRAGSKLRNELMELVRYKDEANWRIYAMLRFMRANRVKQSVFFESWRSINLRESPPNFSHCSTPELMDLLVYLEFDEIDVQLNSLRNRVREYLARYLHDQISEKLFLFHEELFKRSSRINGLAGEIMASHRPIELH